MVENLGYWIVSWTFLLNMVISTVSGRNPTWQNVLTKSGAVQKPSGQSREYNHWLDWLLVLGSFICISALLRPMGLFWKSIPKILKYLIWQFIQCPTVHMGWHTGLVTGQESFHCLPTLVPCIELVFLSVHSFNPFRLLYWFIRTRTLRSKCRRFKRRGLKSTLRCL